MFDDIETFPCPCCGHLVFDFPPGYHQVCPICLWEDDVAQLRFPLMPGGANRVSLLRAQQHYTELGVADLKNQGKQRCPDVADRRDRDWRPLQPGRDNMEEPRRGVRYGDSYPLDTTVLYYWRATFRRPQIC